MPDSAPHPVDHQASLLSRAGLYRAMVDPLWLARDVLGYTKISSEFHGPMLDEMWERDLRRRSVRESLKEQVASGVLPRCFVDRAYAAGRQYDKNEGECWSRGHYKTTIFIVRSAKLILLWPEVTISHWHAVEKNATDCSEELGDHFQTRRVFRKLRPEIMPDPEDGRFNTKSGFTVNRREIVEGHQKRKERHPTFFPKGAGSEVTGKHAHVGWLDDIVGEKTIEDSGMPKIRRWLGKTVSMVINHDGGWLWGTYTPWDESDVMVSWEKNDALWNVRTRPCWKDEEKKEGVLLTAKELRRLKHDPDIDFGFQMECERVPDSEKRWPNGWKGQCKRDWALEGNGRIFVLSDPAPMGMSIRGDKDRQRGDTGKDFWSICVVRLRVRGDFQDIILLDGAHSQTWHQDEGYDEICRLMKLWGTNLFFDEDYANQLFEPFYRAAKRNNVQPRLERRADGRGQQLPKYKESYVKLAKKQRFQKLCDHAAVGCVWVADSCSDEFAYGNRDSTGAITQATKWIPRRGAESNLKWDDDFDVFARSTDSKLQEYAPKPGTKPVGSVPVSDPYGRERHHERRGPTLTRYI